MSEALVIVAATSADRRERDHGRTAAAALSDRHTVTTIDLVAEGVEPAMSRAERAAYHSDRPLLDPVITRHAAMVTSATALVFVFPTAWWTPPPILKAWLERTFVPGVSFVLDERHRVAPALTHLRAIAGITRHGRPDEVAVAGDGARRMLLRTIRLNAPRRVTTAWVTEPGPGAIERALRRL